MPKRLILFESVHFLMKAEKHCVEFHIPYQIIPNPKEVTTECGMSLEIDSLYESQVMRFLEERGIKAKVFKPGGSENT